MECSKCWPRFKSFHVKILLLDKQELILEVQNKTTGQDLLDNIFKHLNLIETAYFGLRFVHRIWKIKSFLFLLKMLAFQKVMLHGAYLILRVDKL